MAIRVIHIFFSFLIFISSTGFTVNIHYCQNELKGVRIFFQPETCHSKKTKKACHKDSKPSCTKEASCMKGCCNNTSDYVKLDQDQQINGVEFKVFSKPIMIADLWFALNINIEDIDVQTIEYLNYKPPLISIDFLSVLQTFRL